MLQNPFRFDQDWCTVWVNCTAVLSPTHTHHNHEASVWDCSSDNLLGRFSPAAPNLLVGRDERGMESVKCLKISSLQLISNEVFESTKVVGWEDIRGCDKPFESYNHLTFPLKKKLIYWTVSPLQEFRLHSMIWVKCWTIADNCLDWAKHNVV